MTAPQDNPALHLPLPLVLASSSRYRAQMLAEAGIASSIDPPQVDERSFDELFDKMLPAEFAMLLATKKAESVASRHSAALVLAGDQVGVLVAGGVAMQLHKQPVVDAAVDQLMAMSGSTHELVNALVLMNTLTGQVEQGIDIQRVSMRPFSRVEAQAYVEEFKPFDCAGSYRLEDQGLMAAGSEFVIDVQGEDPSGVLGLPIPLLRRMLAAMTQE
jgi:septum formation protein